MNTTMPGSTVRETLAGASECNLWGGHAVLRYASALPHTLLVQINGCLGPRVHR
jgi:hypothetical protein